MANVKNKKASNNPLTYWNQILEGFMLRALEDFEELVEANQQTAAELSRIAQTLKSIDVTLAQLAPPKAQSATLKIVKN